MKLIFVYNAESGLGNAFMDLLHKTFRPESYECNLCLLTYGGALKKKEWQAFLDGLGVETEFEYRDTLAERYGLRDAPLPAIFCQEGEGPPALWMEAATLNGYESLEALQEGIGRRRLETCG